MSTFKFQGLSRSLAATVVAAAFTSFAMTPAQAQTHSHDATAPAKLSPAQYAALAGQVEGEIGGIVANFKLEPKADAVAPSSDGLLHFIST